MGSLSNKRAAIVKNGLVVNIVVISEESEFKQEGFEVIELTDNSPVSIMWTVDPENPGNFIKYKEESYTQ